MLHEFSKYSSIVVHLFKGGNFMKEGLIKAKFSKEIRKELKPLMKKNNYYNIIALIIDWSLILGCSAASVFF